MFGYQCNMIYYNFDIIFNFLSTVIFILRPYFMIEWTCITGMSKNIKILNIRYCQLFILRDPLQNDETVCHRRGLCRMVQCPED